MSPHFGRGPANAGAREFTTYDLPDDAILEAAVDLSLYLDMGVSPADYADSVDVLFAELVKRGWEISVPFLDTPIPKMGEPSVRFTALRRAGKDRPTTGVGELIQEQSLPKDHDKMPGDRPGLLDHHV